MLIFPGRKMSMGKNEYATPEQPTAKTSTKVTNAGKKNGDIVKSHTDYLRFSWCYGNTVKYYTFLVLPFVLSSVY
jgi:hypothetical protein